MWWSQSGNHLEENLAIFGYQSDMKVFFGNCLKKKILSIILSYQAGAYHKILAIWKYIYISSKSGGFGPFFPWKRSFVYKLRPYFSKSKFGEHLQIKQMSVYVDCYYG